VSRQGIVNYPYHLQRVDGLYLSLHFIQIGMQSLQIDYKNIRISDTKITTRYITMYKPRRGCVAMHSSSFDVGRVELCHPRKSGDQQARGQEDETFPKFRSNRVTLECLFPTGHLLQIRGRL